MKEEVVKEVATITLDKIPWQIWVFLGGQFVAFVFTWGRALLRIKKLEDDKVIQKEMYDKISATREDVAEIKGMLGNRSGD